MEGGEARLMRIINDVSDGQGNDPLALREQQEMLYSLSSKGVSSIICSHAFKELFEKSASQRKLFNKPRSV